MSAIIIDGKTVARDIRAEIKEKAATLAVRGIVPGLAVVLVGEDPASVSYVTAKEKACAENGLASIEKRLPASASQDELLSIVRAFNIDPAVHGILVQLPLPKHIDERAVIAAIAPEKDVDGFTPVNVGRMVLDEPCYLPCTPAGVIELIKRSGVKTDGARAVVVGRSNIVGKPLMNLLVRRSINATVTVCHTGTKDLASHCRGADILIACAGRAGLITGDMIKPGACVIDVGVNRVEDPSSSKGYRLRGDIDYESALEVAGWITPVPGGVGPMTITMLLANTVEAAARTAP
ncbi:MAG: bifunctional methylenetetrahydrofolate dehydrogenase/methenyltetrahydrofolate cyclohydrolase FolD [Rectinemataceae bacterium]|nr:bifunctional methylenetetrahydrofolate dehydrogenase/methenyltetrahydrofolate cyclohydrolase FolD [Rectinemataceae bacterium]